MDQINAVRAQIQAEMIGKIVQSIKEGHHEILVQGQTGIGKTHIQAAIAAGAAGKGNPVLIVAPWRKITKQIHGIMARYGLEPSFLMAGHPHTPQALVQVACANTLKNRVKRAKDIRKCETLLDILGPMEGSGAFPPARIVMIDECHRDTNAWLREIYPDALIIGFTATPINGDGNGLGDQYTDLILGPPTRELIKAGILLPTRVVYPKGVRITRKDPHLLGQVAETWMQHAFGKRTIVFAKSVAHSKHLCEKFNEAGIPAEHIDSSMSDEPGEDGLSERDRMYERLISGEIKVICNFGILVEGVDIPAIECIILARPDKKHLAMNLITYIQAKGRGARPYTDPIKGPQEYFTLIDLTKTVEKMGMHPDDDWPWTLDAKAKDTVERMMGKKKEKEDEPEKLVHCACGEVYPPAPKCPKCGREMPKRNGALIEVPVHLVEWGSRVDASVGWTDRKVISFYRQTLGALADKEDWKARRAALAIAEKIIPEGQRKTDKELRLIGVEDPSPEIRKMVKDHANQRRKQYFALLKKGIDPSRVMNRKRR